MNWARKLMGIDPVRKWNKAPGMPVYTNDVGIYGIGVKDDKDIEFPMDGRKYEVEGL